VERLAQDLTARLGRGFSRRNVFLMRAFYLGFPRPIVQTTSALSSESDTSQPIVQTVSAQSAPAGKCQTPSGESISVIRSTPSNISETPSRNSAVKLASFDLPDLARAFPLPWSHYVLLISRSRSPEAFAFYHTEALRGGWSVRQLQRQMDSQFYERTALSRFGPGQATGARVRMMRYVFCRIVLLTNPPLKCAKQKPAPFPPA
jgi:hypothetical protein